VKDIFMYQYFYRDRELANPEPSLKFYTLMDGLVSETTGMLEAIVKAKKLAEKYSTKTVVYVGSHKKELQHIFFSPSSSKHLRCRRRLALGLR